MDTGLRLPPHNLECEQAVIAAILLDARVLDDVIEIVAADDFYRREHREIFQAAARLHERGQAIDALTVADSMDADSDAQEYLLACLEASPTTANARHYAQTVKDKSVLRGLISVGHKIADIGFDAELPPLEAVNAAHALMADVGEEADDGEAVQADAISKALIDDIQFRFDNPDAFFGMRTGFTQVDDLTGGFEPGALIIVAGRPGMGKSVFLMNVVERATLQDKLCVVFSLEMPRKSLLERTYSSLSGVYYDQIRKARLNEEDWPKLSVAVGKLKGKPLWIDDSAALTTAQVRARIRRIERKAGRKVDLIAVDYLQLLGDQSRENETQRTTMISRNLKQMAKEFSCPVLALSQLNRDVEKASEKRPGLADLRGSGSIEQDADLVMFLYRDEYYNKNTRFVGIAELIVAKNRAGETKTIPLKSELGFMRFLDHLGPMPAEECAPSNTHFFDRKRA